jgi:hypothetical protein
MGSGLKILASADSIPSLPTIPFNRLPAPKFCLD